MKKLYFSLALLFGLSGTASAQTEELIVTDVGSAVTTLSQISTLASEGTYVMLYNYGRDKYLENHVYSDGTYELLLGYDLSVSTSGNGSFLWQLVAGSNENEYYLKSYSDGKYLFMDSDFTTTTVSTTQTDSVDTYYVIESGAEGIFYFSSSNVNDDPTTLTENETVLLNGNGMESGADYATVVGWYYDTSDIDNSEYMIYVPTTEYKTMYTVTLNMTFYDGSSDVTLVDANLSDLIPDDVDTETMTYTLSGAVGDTLEVPSFDYNDVRSITFGGTSISDTTTFVLTEAMVADGAAVDVAYTSYPQITFTCVIDATLVNAELTYLWDETNSTTQTTTERVAVGETITAPTFDNFTAVTEIEDNVASTSKSYEITYRPWRQFYADCYYFLGDTEVLFESTEIYVDIDSLMTGPDMGELYTFSADLTNEYGGNEMEVPFTVTVDNVYEGMYFNFYYTLTSPITTSDVTDDGQFPDDATWYIVSLRGSKILTNETNDSGYLVLDASADIDDNSLWCFRQNEDGTYYVYNRAMPGYVLCDVYNEEYPTFAEATGSEQGFEMLTISTGYGFRVPDSYYIWNDYSNNTPGQLAYWNSESALTDAGSMVTFEEYDPANYMFLDGRAVLNAVNCLNGFDADDELIIELAGLVEDLDEAYESDVTSIVYELLEYTDEERVQYNADHAYAIISAAPSYISKNNVKYALYVQGDSTLAWKEFNEYDRSHYFMVGNMKDLESSTGEVDSTVVTLQGVESGKYVAATAWAYAQPLGMTDELVDSICYFHLDPVDEYYYEDEDDDEPTIIPAAFYIDRWWYYQNDASQSMVLCTMSLHAGSIDNTTEGTIVSYNTRSLSYANMFRFYDTGNTADVVGIGSVVNDEAATSADGTDAIYDLTGRRVQKATKGVYIQNGKKVYVK